MKRYRTIIALIAMLAMIICMTACSKADEDAEDQTTDSTETVQTDEETEEEDTAPTAEVVKTIEGVDEDLGPYLPLMIDSIILYDDGSVAIIPTDDLKKNEIKDDAEAVYPFEESGEVADIYVVGYGNGGYRTILALLKDGTISVVNGRALVEDHIFAVIDNVANRENFVSVENRTEDDGTYIVATTEDGSEVVLDYSLNFDEPE